tara:strand:- start:142 stop:1059 length:918 start_codon:yes stop_codon:yes gene_type:complete
MVVGFNFFIYLKLNTFLKYLFFIPTIIIIFLEFFSGSISFPFMLILYIYFLFFCFKKKFFIIPIILIFILASFYNLIKNDFRKLVSDQVTIENKITNTDQNLKYKLKAFVWVSEKNIRKINENYELKNINFFSSIKTRLFHSGRSLLVVTQNTPKNIEYLNGESLKFFVIKFIPRIFWKNKPNDEFGNKFGKIYGILIPGDEVTSWNMPVLNEFYVNYGIKGIIIGMMLFGIFLNILTRFFNIENDQSYFLILGSIIIYPLYNIESHLSQSVGNFLIVFIFMTIIIYILKKIISIFNFKLTNKIN